MRHSVKFFWLLIVVALAAPLFGAAIDIPSSPKQHVTDTAGFLSPAARQALNDRLRDYEQRTGHQVVVWIGRTTGGPALEEWAVEAFEKWKIGRQGIDDGVLLVIMADDRKLRFEIGYGLEGIVPDALAGRIINQEMTPRIRAGDRDGAVTAGIDTLLRTIDGGATGEEALKPPPQTEPRRIAPQAEPPSLLKTIAVGIAALIFLFILITNPSLALYLLWAMSSGGRGGGHHGGWGGGGGGGFSGGGGRSGGGGASGSW